MKMQIYKDEPVKVWPNPTEGKFKVQSSNSKMKFTELALNLIFSVR